MDYFNDIEFVLCGYMDKAQMNTRNRLFEGYYGLQYLHSGALNVQIGDNPPEYFDSPGVFITYPGVPFSYGSPPGTARAHAFMCFKGPRAARYIQSGLMELRERDIFRTIVNPDEFLHTALRLIQYANTPGIRQHAKAVWLLEELLLSIREQPEISDKLYMRYSVELKKLRDEVAARPLKKWDFAREAAHIGLSYVHFCRLFKEITGWSPGAFHLECRLRHASNLLVNTSNRILEISTECGFTDAYHFSRIFKKHNKLSPSEFRKLYS